MMFGHKAERLEARRLKLARKRRGEVSELKRMWRISSQPPIVTPRPSRVYLPPPGVIARGLLFRSY